MKERSIPEIQRTNLASVLLHLKALGINDIASFAFLSRPSQRMMSNALELLHSIGAIDSDVQLTSPVGLQLAEFPVEPSLAVMLLASGAAGCAEEVMSIAALLSVESVFMQPTGAKRASDRARLRYGVREGDHLTLLNGTPHLRSMRAWLDALSLAHSLILCLCDSVQCISQEW